MNKKKIIVIILSIFLISGISNKIVYAQDDNGKIDLYECFSSKEDKMKTEVGSRIYKWSMHLPDDGVIYKSERANFFNMSTNSYQTSIQLEVNKNKDEITLEELLYKMQNESDDRLWGNYYDSKEFVVDIQTDETGKKYIRIIKSNLMYDYFMVNEAAKEFSDYIENRIYIENNYIYNLTVSMKGEFYRQHEEMFEKLVSSFKLSFDDKNPFIKELSDSVSNTREYKNASYGWKIMMSPYWRVEGAPNAQIQKFNSVYSDDELNIDKTNAEKNSEDELKIPEGITVSLVSSADNSETASSWAQKELEILKNKYNNQVYQVLNTYESVQDGCSVYHMVVRYKTLTKNPYVIHNLYAIGNGYKYLVSATMKDEKYNDVSKRAEFDNMLNSFALDKTSLSKYLGKIVSAKSMLNLNDSKDIKMKNYNFGTKVTKGWYTLRNGQNFDFNDMYLNQYVYEKFEKMYRENINDNDNNEYIAALEPVSNIHVDMNAGLDTNEINEIVKKRLDNLSKDDEVRMGLAKVKIKSSEYDGAQLYYIEKEYDLNSIMDFVKTDKTKAYDLEKLQNQYEYIIKMDKDTYTETISIPVANSTDINKSKVTSIWKNTFVKNNNYSNKNIIWKDHTLEEFEDEKNN